MLKLVLILGAWFDLILCEMQSQKITFQAPSCRNPLLCYLPDVRKKELRNISFPLYPSFQNYARQQSNLQRSYYNGFDSSVLPAYYHAFDPISVLASLAFLAFLLQSFASLFDHSRSILPTIINGRRSIMDLTTPEISKHLSHTLRDYENLSEDIDGSK